MEEEKEPLGDLPAELVKKAQALLDANAIKPKPEDILAAADGYEDLAKKDSNYGTKRMDEENRFYLWKAIQLFTSYMDAAPDPESKGVTLAKLKKELLGKKFEGAGGDEPRGDLAAVLNSGEKSRAESVSFDSVPAKLKKHVIIDIDFVQKKDAMPKDNRHGTPKIEGDVAWVSDPSFRGDRKILHIRRGVVYWPADPAFSVQEGTLAAFVSYEGGNGSIAGLAQENWDMYSMIVWTGSKLGTFMGWPNCPCMLTTHVMPRQKWTFVTYSWSKGKASFTVDGKDVGAIESKARVVMGTGRLEVGINSPGGDEYLNMRIASLVLFDRVIGAKDAKDLMRIKARAVGFKE